MRKIILISAASVFFLASFAWPQQGPTIAAGGQGVIVSGKPAATAAGIKILEQGGNAADAGAATLLALSVTSVGAYCVGGEIPILVYSADQKTVKLLEGQGEAPRDPKAIAWYMKNGIPDGDVKAAAVPGAIDAVVARPRARELALANVYTLLYIYPGGKLWPSLAYLSPGTAKL